MNENVLYGCYVNGKQEMVFDNINDAYEYLEVLYGTERWHERKIFVMEL